MNDTLARDLRRISHDGDRWLADARERLSRRAHATPATPAPTRTKESTDE
ncbi:hypothetical protein FB381_4727 [Nocardioides albertanoniae]|uniref:Uncharacterized protein n=1 Tax=Nocardioides albertanoniae TaxID=1175486 RepID=A0A543ADX0_9ACTN|nr:hypothetical protein [Nocardioides albertanoniae]TQL70785.1 hypothetical protein FB381_4727 [Nocardioides albertanoniae]